jgi:PAS domain S-box-containing protein
MEPTITYKHIFDSTSNGVIATDEQGHIVLINQQASKILGLKRKNVAGTHILEVLPLTGQLVVNCLQTGRPQLGRHIHGKNINLVVNCTATRQGGKIIGTVSNFQRMRQFEHSARQLQSYKRLNRQLDSIFQYSSDIIWVYDGEGKVININKAAEAANKIKVKDVIGKSYAEVVELGILDRSVVPEVLKTKRQVSIVQDWFEGRSTGLITGTPVFDDSGNIDFIVVNARDMTQLNKIKEELDENRMVAEKFKDELTELNLLELKEQEIIAESKEMRQALRIAVKLARMEASNILILGESGTGKGLLAKFIHNKSKRKKHPFIQINCAALPESLLEAELFGYEKGAFTGARERGKIGLFELAQKGTLFLDEISDLPFSVQAKLLKYLDDQEIMRLGATQSRKVDCVIIAATNSDLEDLVKKRKFRQDLFYRLNTFTILIPPLRERREDILELINYFLEKYCAEYHLQRHISMETMEKIKSYPFSGNVRELKNIIKKAVVISDGPELDELIERSLRVSGDLSFSAQAGGATRKKKGLVEQLTVLEKEILLSAMNYCKSTKDLAMILGVSQPTAFRKMKKHGLRFKSIHK